MKPTSQVMEGVDDELFGRCVDGLIRRAKRLGGTHQQPSRYSSYRIGDLVVLQNVNGEIARVNAGPRRITFLK